MSSHKNDNFGDRQAAAASAKAAMLERFRARPAPDSPEVLERQAELKAIRLAREARISERATARAAAAAKLVAEQKALAAEQAAREAEEAKRAKALAAEQKAARDARYAARTARRR